MKCPKCQTDNKEGAKFCVECGQKFEVKCPRCGHSLPCGAKFCEECGYQLSLLTKPIPDSYLGLGTLYRRGEKREQAKEHLGTASKMFREMDMRFWLEKAEAEMKELPGGG